MSEIISPRLKTLRSTFMRFADSNQKLAENIEKENIVVKFNNKEYTGQSNLLKPASFINDPNILAIRVGEELWDLNRPLESNCTIESITFDSLEGKKIYWNSAAYVLEKVLIDAFKGRSCFTNVTESGFFCDILSDNTISEKDYPKIEEKMRKFFKREFEFERYLLHQSAARKIYEGCWNLQRYLVGVPPNSNILFAKCGEDITFNMNLSGFPHVKNTKLLKLVKITKNSSSERDGVQYQRVHGVCFPNMKYMEAWQDGMRKAVKKDHHSLGIRQELFFSHPLSPGCAFFLPHGTRIYNKLASILRKEYEIRGYEEVITPNIFNAELWRITGHLNHYKDNMFQIGEDEFLKPMGCAGHCLLYQHRIRSYRELPIRYAEFGVLHRNESHGSLTGLTRMRKFVQDDAHIFCTLDMVEGEIRDALSFMKKIYGLFDFEFDLELSTRPKDFMGNAEDWDKAEDMMRNILDGSGSPWKLNEGDGAFYGPKIDIHIKDALKRSHQCATIQLDFQLPANFKLTYQDENEIKQPVIIHRAIYGSFERFIGLLCEHFAGQWPFWLSPRQVKIIPISDKFLKECQEIKNKVKIFGFYVDIDETDRPLSKKIAMAEVECYNYMLVVGQKELESNTVNVREHGNEKLVEWKLEDFLNGLTCGIPFS